MNQPPPAPQPHAKRSPVQNVDGDEQKKRVKRGGRRGKGSGRLQPEAAAAGRAVGDATPAPPHKRQEQDSDMESKMAHLSETAFASLAISDHSKRAIVEELRYEYLTHVQNETFEPILSGKDVLAKAKTGNGKTMAFLLPMIERLVEKDRSRSSIPALVISPTRELALQITTEARRLTKFHDFNIACFVGGTPINRDARVLQAPTPVDMLIATPGRLLDHVGQDTGSIKAKLQGVLVFVLDEADRLLDMGFRPDLMRIMACLPSHRQTLLFSATLPASTEELKRVALRDDYVFVDTIEEDDHQTNAQAVQEYVVCPLRDVIPTVEYVLSEHMKQRAKDFKVMLFFPTARAAQFMAQLFTAAGFSNVLEMHSRKSQSVRTKTADTFRNNKRVIMFSSDVSARGVDYPDVTLVLQVGLTDRDQYIHRLGRTARAGTDGHGILVLADFERPLLKDLKDLPLQETTITIHAGESRTMKAVQNLKPDSELEKSAQQSYQAWLGFYNTHVKRLQWTKELLVQVAAEYSALVGLREVPKLEKKTLKKMNLFGVAGIEAAPFNGGGGNGRGNNGGGRGGNGNVNGNNGGRGGRGNGNGNGNAAAGRSGRQPSPGPGGRDSRGGRGNPRPSPGPQRR
ncbi:hypothetical protein ATCC90586_006584 [Pythium insidiosum]|nr:hypothetical protein ATCC90586_006584 [Pythium insidiosum]